MAMTKQLYKNDSIIFRTIDELVPNDHLVRKLDECMNFSFIEDKVEHLYSKGGRASIPPIVLFNLIFINKIFGINSMRRTCEECKVNLAYRWFLGLSMEDDIPNYSTWSQNYIRRYKDSDIFNEIFEEILRQAIEYGYIDLEAVFYDGTHQKANANKRKCTDEEVEIKAKAYKDELLNEINEVRKEHEQKPFKTINNEELDFSIQTGEEITKVKTKHIKKSTTDPDSGHYHKGEHEQCFAYTHNTVSDKNGFVLAVETTPGNVHDSTSFDDVRKKVMDKFSNKINFEVLDAGYKTPAICREIIEDNKLPLLPYTRPKGNKELIGKRDFEYDEEHDVYICPNESMLKYSTTTKEGYKQYKSNPEICSKCPLREQCTKSKNHQKIISVHVWNKYVEQANELRYTETWKEIYPLRKQTIERIFGDCKENMGLRFTRVRGLEKNKANATMIFACHNLKKMALWHNKNNPNMSKNTQILSNIFKLIVNLIKKIKNKRLLTKFIYICQQSEYFYKVLFFDKKIKNK